MIPKKFLLTHAFYCKLRLLVLVFGANPITSHVQKLSILICSDTDTWQFDMLLTSLKLPPCTGPWQTTRPYTDRYRVSIWNRLEDRNTVSFYCKCNIVILVASDSHCETPKNSLIQLLPTQTVISKIIRLRKSLWMGISKTVGPEII